MEPVTTEALDFTKAQQVAPLLVSNGVRVHLFHISGKADIRGSDIEGILGYRLDCQGALWSRPTPTVVTGAFNYVVRLNLRVTPEEDAKDFGELIVRYGTTYRLKDEAQNLDNELLRNFVAYYGFIHLWPYARADFQMLSARLELPVLTLPMMSPGTIPDSLTLAYVQPPEDSAEVAELPKSGPDV